MKSQLLSILLFISLLFWVKLSFSQKPIPNIDIGLGLDGAAYIGDLNLRSLQPQNVSIGYSLSARFSRNPHFYNNFQVGKLTLSEQSSQYQVLNTTNIYEPTYFFSTNAYYASYQLHYFPFRNYRILPYIKAGLAATRFTPFDKEGNNLSANTFSRVDGETFSGFTYFIPLGLGLQLKVNPICFLTLDYTYNFLGTDYMDNIGQAGKENGKDAFQSLRAGILLRIGQMQAVTPSPIANNLILTNDSAAKTLTVENNIPKKETLAKQDSLKIGKSADILVKKDSVNEVLTKLEWPKPVPTDSIKTENVVVLKTDSIYLPKNEKVDTAKVVTKSNPPKENIKKPTTVSPKPAANLAVLGNRSLDYQYPILRLTPYPVPPEVVQQDRETKIKIAILGEDFFNYTSQAGDTWESIAKEFDIPEAILKVINNMDAEELPLGTSLKIPEVKE